MLAFVSLSAPEQTQFGRNLSRLRANRTWTQEELAEKADLHWRYLQKLEVGDCNPSLRVIARLKKALGCEWDELLKDIG